MAKFNFFDNIFVRIPGGGGGGGGGAPGGVGPIMYHSLILVSNLSNFELKITAGAEE